MSPLPHNFRLHVLHVIDQLAVGGAERMLVDLANQTSLDGYRVSVCITRAGGELKSELRPEIEVLELARQRRFDWQAICQLGRFVRQQQVDILHVHGRFSFSLVALAKALRFIPLPVLLHDHYGTIETDRSVPYWFRFASKYYLNQYVGVYCQLGKWAFAAGIPPEHIHVIGNALDLQRLMVKSSIPECSDFSRKRRGLTGVTVAGIRREKGTDTLLRAIAQVPRDLAFSLLIVGRSADDAFTDQCRNLCSELGITDRVEFLGLRRDVPTLLQQADFAVMSSRSESGPLVLIEYMAFGLPFVATRVGDISQKVELLGLDEFIPPEDPNKMADAIERLLRLPSEERQHRGATGQKIAEQHFDIRAVAPEWYKLYKQMVKS